ncbi:amino acid ABC transporter permease [Janibacter sp. GS2]|uniref:amino acid ABC transporter permease n=1 Tax=Janibacter sp. GS2 TaxID=3442646 RepID=UPI003EB80B42
MSASSVLFDAPGPRARRLQRVATVVGAVVLLGILGLMVRALYANGELEAAKWEGFLTVADWRYYLLPGIVKTLQAAALSIALALVFGFVLGAGRLSGIRVVRWISSIVVEFFRAVPVLIMMIFFFGVYAFNGVFDAQTNPFAAVVTALMLYNGSVIAELLRSGVHSLPAGQSEAGYTIGLTRGQVLRSIQLPQAVTAMLPALVSQLVVINKDTALGYIITYPELLQQSNNLASARSNVIPALLVAAALFIAINSVLAWAAGRLEMRLARRGQRAAKDPAAVAASAATAD